LKNLSLFRSWSFLLDLGNSFFGVDFWFRIRPSVGSIRSLPADLFSRGCVRVLAFLSRVKARPGFGAVEIALGFVPLAFSRSAPSWLSRLRPEATAPPPLVPIFVKEALGLRLPASLTRAAVGAPAFPAARRHGSLGSPEARHLGQVLLERR
jgi:hypothetical protein